MQYQKFKSINSICNEINKQRMNLLELKRKWITVMSKYDNYWNSLMSIKKYLLIGSSILLIFCTRFHTFNLIIRSIKFGYLGIYIIYKIVRYFIRFIIKFV
ncbi:hypothetical protein CRV11_02335 [Candidatus Pantoea edessiphila]|uniref:Cell division protein FtsH n=1 Tax=Candidatus Pantoea edessiphila TaxID=2044610 RepID=A0A2P5SXT6_9GAMM|nr:hypothetical protein [Pantoea sp. Edef]PPI87134.1 hypothetical protein CRV11_02335 [Candidatus Pantoea edessiphila]